MYNNNSIINSIKIFSIITMMVCSIHVQASDAIKEKSNYQPPTSLPSEMALVDYEKLLYKWVLEFNYKKLSDWKVDHEVRDTGPFIDQKDFGTHGAVRIYYSPETMTWLNNGRVGTLPDGAIIIKEMYTPPAAIYQELSRSSEFSTDGKTNAHYEKMLESVITSWVVMVKDKNLSADGWFWGSVEIKKDYMTIQQTIDNYEVDTLENRGNSQLRWSGAAMPCIRCHASAKSEMTFVDEENINGNPLVFRTDDSWRTASYFKNHNPLSNIKDNDYVLRFMNTQDFKGHVGSEITEINESGDKTQNINLDDHSLRNNAIKSLSSSFLTVPNEQFLSTFSPFPQVEMCQVETFPPQWMDHVVMPPKHQQIKKTEHITSDNCVGCHGGLSGGINREVMFIPNSNYQSSSDQIKNGYNVSEFGEWRWSPMGLAGRDPIFHSQLESEMNLLIRDNKLDKKNNNPKKKLLKGTLAATQKAVTNKCLTCHGAMGQRQLAIDAKTDSNLNADFKSSYFYLKEAVTEKQVKQQQKDGTHKYVKYGALAREGISCMICHQIDAPNPENVKNWAPINKKWLGKNLTEQERTLAYNLFHHSSGEYRYGTPGDVFGPFNGVKTKPMEHSLTLNPMHNEYIQDSQMCGNCHTINLPNIGSTEDKFPVLTAAADPNFPAFKDYNHTIEQATFVEWQNSLFSVKPKKNQKSDTFASCQDCHMENKFESLDENIIVDPIVTQIASIQDSSYPAVGESLPNQDIDVPVRDDYSRHTHVGLNVFLLSMMDQFGDQFLGLGKADYMTGSITGPQFAMENMIQQAQNKTANISIGKITVETQNHNSIRIKTPVKVVNKTGHRYPSGVAFRRAFLEFTIRDGYDTIIWQSGGTNGVGVITNFETQMPLTSEFLPSTGKNNPIKEVQYQPHYQVISKPTQVQIYEELNLNAQNQFTTSFVHRVNLVKDNRLLPKGWKESRFFKSQGQVLQQFMAATDPHAVDNDPDYVSQNNLKFAGEDNLIYDISLKSEKTIKGPLTVSVTLYNQSIPPYWLNHRFTESPEGLATQRLYYMSSRLNLKNTPMENWKLKLVSDKKEIDVFN